MASPAEWRAGTGRRSCRRCMACSGPSWSACRQPGSPSVSWHGSQAHGAGPGRSLPRLPSRCSWPRRRNHRQLEAGRGGPGHRCRFVDDGRSASGRRSRGGGRRPDVCRRSVPGELRGATGNPQPDGSPGPHTAHRGHRSRWKLGGPARPGRAGAPPAGSARRCRRGRRNDRERHRNPGSFRPDRRVRARQAGRGRARHERGHQCRRCLLPARDETGGREHLTPASCDSSRRPGARRRRWPGSPTGSPSSS